MGMVLALVSIDDQSLEKLRADPPLIWKVLAPDDPEMYEAERKERSEGQSWFSRLFGKKEEGTPPAEGHVPIPKPVEEIDLDKSWHGIHYLLTGTAWEGDAPLNFLVLGGKEIGDIDVGYGTARAFSSSEVRTILNAIEPITQQTLGGRFDGAAMMKLEIYPEIWDRDPADDPVLEYCTEYFESLKNFLGRTSERGLGMLVYIS
jgi:Domain of unknown function (DUF1877)